MTPETTDALVPRRTLLGLLGLGALATVTGCGGDAGLVTADVARRPGDPARVPAVVDAVSAFGTDLLGVVGADDGNVVCSPWSVLVALAMVRNGATGVTAREMDEALHLPDLAGLNAGLGTLDQELATRAGRRRDGDGEEASVVLDAANRVWGRQGSTWEPAFLAALAAWYGTGVGATDLGGDPEGARRSVNAWVAEQTHDRITELMPRGSLQPETRMVLANALYVRAPWHERFGPAEPLDFTGPGGTGTVPSMQVTLPGQGLAGDGWAAARVPLAGQELALTVVRPDGGLADLRARLRDGGLTRLLRTAPDRGVALRMPPVRLRTELDLVGVLEGLGMRRAFATGLAEFDGMTRSERLHVGAVRHQGWLALDEDGLEAAAATGVAMDAVSAPSIELELTLDRPFLACLHDVATALPLLLVQVGDPAARAA
ncbi:serpin B [Friedmanniella luteola]|uniref:Serpin B n=1 Tax=Friedmanniella luteola TaxID=546871 RepID=A0A1H1PL12_9ACTN|nr:serpin family protein [Friedmanniella luteola]SDS11767.1 serpin B [Friedmanniella luteola]